MNVADDQVLNADQVAEILDVHPRTLTRYLRTGELKGAKHGNRWFIRRSAVDAFLEPEQTDVA